MLKYALAVTITYDTGKIKAWGKIGYSTSCEHSLDTVP